jgi:NAD+ diphosphatase
MAERGLTPRPGFTGFPLDRADHLRLDEERLAVLGGHAEARLLRLEGADPVLDEAGRLAWDSVVAGTELIFLGLKGETPLFAPLVGIEPGRRAWSVFQTIDSMAREEAALWGAARSLLEWHSRHGFCPACGHETAIFRGGWGRRCGRCGSEHFPRVDPVVIMLAEHQDRVLLGRQRQYPARRYSALAGFVEPGESIEEAVARELKEEAAVETRNVRYVASQPWPFPGQLMIACIAEAVSEEIEVDTRELEDAKWFDRSGVAAALARHPQAPFLAPPHFAIANTLLAVWLAD